MADPNNPSIEDISAAAAGVDTVNSALGALNSVTELAGKLLSGINNKCKEFGVNLQSTTRLTEGQAAAFGAFTAATIGAGTAFDNFGNFDTSGLSTMKGQIEDLEKILLGSNKEVLEATDKLNRFAQSGSKDASVFKTLTDGLATAKETALAFAAPILETAKNMASSSDQALKLENGFLQLSARTGNLDTVLKAAGPGLENLNLLMDDQRHMMERSAGATHLSTDEIAKYYGALGTVHGALGSVVQAGDGSSKTIDTLTATIQIAKGSGREYKDIIDDMRLAYKDYGIEGEKALKFTAQMGEIANKTGVDLEDVRTALRNTADSFKMFGNNADGAANMMNNYIESLKRSGISGSAAIDVIKDMTGSIQGMDISKKAFLSGGGLAGAFQIDKLLKEGKIDEVMEMTRKKMTQMMGGQKIVSLEEAGKSQSAAAQMAKQVAILRQGPLGSMAKTDQEAYAILGSFKEKQEGRVGTIPTALNQNVVQDAAKTGNMLLEKQDTKLADMRRVLQASQLEAQGINLNTKELLFATRKGIPSKNEIAEIRDMRDRNQRSMAAYTYSGSETEEATNRLKTGNIKETGRQGAADSIKNMGKFIEELGLSIKAPFEAIKNMVTGGASGTAIKDTLEEHKANIKKRQESVMSSSMNKKQKNVELAKLNEESEKYNQFENLLSPNMEGKKYSTPKREEILPTAVISENKLPSAATRVGQAAISASGRTALPSATTVPSTQATAIHQRSSTNLPTAEPTQVHITAYCAACHNLIHGSQQSHGTNVGQKL